MKLKLTMTEPTEADVMRAVLAYLQHHQRVVWAARMNTGAGMLTRGNGKFSQYIKFGFKGCPDIHGMLAGGQALYIEVKRPSGKLTPEQEAFLKLAVDNGGCAFVARSVDDCVSMLK